MLGVEDERGVHGAHEAVGWCLAVQQMEEVTTDAVVVGFHLDPATMVREMIPVEQDRSERGHQPVGDIARVGDVVIVGFGQDAAERRHARAHDVHRMRGRRNRFQGFLHRTRQPTQGSQLLLVGGELRRGWQRAMDQQMGDFFELARLGKVEDVIAAIMQVIAGPSDGAQRGVAGRHARERDRFLRLEGRDVVHRLGFPIRNCRRGRGHDRPSTPARCGS